MNQIDKMQVEREKEREMVESCAKGKRYFGWRNRGREEQKATKGDVCELISLSPVC